MEKKYFFSHNIVYKIGFFLVLSMIIAAIFAPYLSTHDPLEQFREHTLMPPSAKYFLGTDSYGRDVFSRLLYGARISLYVGLVSVSISLSLGVTLGLLAGYFRGVVDEVVMRFVDVMLCFPSFFLILAVVALLEASLFNIIVVIGLTSWMGVARLLRAETLSLREREFVQAAQLAGAPVWRILLRHILPNAFGSVLVAATLGVAGAILIESSLSFLGLGGEPSSPSWGSMLLEGKQTIEMAWWLSLFPGLAILLSILGYYIVGEYLRDRFDPHFIR